MPVQAENPPQVQIGAGEILLGAAISVAGMLRAGVTLTGTPVLTVTPSNSPDPTPTATSPVVSTTTLTILGKEVSTGEAIQFTLTGNSAAKKTYTIVWTCSGSDGSTYQGAITFKIV